MALAAGAAGGNVNETRHFGPAEGWRRFHDDHFEMVWRFLVRFGVQEADLEDFSQEVFTVAYRKFGSFRHDATVSTWLYAICRKVAAGARRRASFRRLAVELFGLEPPRAPVAAEAGLRMDVERLLSRLSEVKRMTLLFHEVDGMSPAEIGAVMGCPEATVWSRLRLAWKDLERLRDEETRRSTP